MTPQQNLDSFQNYSWLEDSNIDWIDCLYPEHVEYLFCNTTTPNTSSDEEDSMDLRLSDLNDDLTDIEDDDE